MSYQGQEICTECGKPCGSIEIDEGIGSYEYWGAPGVHHDYRTVSDCCEAEIGENGGTVVHHVAVHTARKDHLSRHGSVIVHAGRRYIKTYTRTWHVDKYGDNVGTVTITKQELAA